MRRPRRRTKRSHVSPTAPANSCLRGVAVVVLLVVLDVVISSSSTRTASAFSPAARTTLSTDNIKIVQRQQRRHFDKSRSRYGGRRRTIAYLSDGDDDHRDVDHSSKGLPSSSSPLALNTSSSRRSFLSNCVKSSVVTIGGTVTATCSHASKATAAAAGTVGANSDVDLTMVMRPPPTLDAASSKDTLDVGLLASRVESNVVAPPPYGMEGTDIFYPSWFSGVWKVESTTRSVEAPCGIGLFGGNSTYMAAKQDIGNTLKYDCRFIPAVAPSGSSQSSVIADREYNVRSIVKSAMGSTAVVDIGTATPNKFSCLLAPRGSPYLIKADLIVLNRRQEYVAENQFDCSEVVREISTPIVPPTNTGGGTDESPMPLPPPQRQSPILKEIETTTLYTYDPLKDEVRAVQRSAAFLLPSNQNEQAMKMWQLSRGQAIDVRFYDVVYRRS